MTISELCKKISEAATRCSTFAELDQFTEALEEIAAMRSRLDSIESRLHSEPESQPVTFDRTPVVLTETPYVKLRRRGFLARTLRDILYGIFREIYEATGEVAVISQPCPAPGEPLFWKGSVHKNKGMWAFCYWDIQYYQSEKANRMLVDLIHERLPKDRPLISDAMKTALGFANDSWVTGDDTGQHDDHLHDRCEGILK